MPPARSRHHTVEPSGRAAPVGRGARDGDAVEGVTIRSVTPTALGAALDGARSGHRRRWTRSLGVGVIAVGLAFGGAGLVPPACAQSDGLTERDADLAERPITSVVVQGIDDTDRQLVQNNLRTASGQPYDARIVRSDVARLYNLGKFKDVTAEAILLADGSVQIVFSLTTQPIVLEVQTIGNKVVSDQELLAVVRQARGGPRDDFLIEKAKREIAKIYRKKGFYLTDVQIDQQQLERGVLIFKVIEGPRVRIRAIEFEGNDEITDSQLHAEIKTRTHLFVLRSGALDEAVLAKDVSEIDRFYKSRGYLDVRVDQGIELSPDNREAKVIFYVSEGRRYVLKSVQTANVTDPDAGLTVFSDEQIAAIMEIKTGDIYSRDKLEQSVERLREAYGGLGYVNAQILPSELRSGPEAEVNLLIEIDEGQFAKAGDVVITGNPLTREKVIRRQLTFKPGRPIDLTQIAESERRLRRSRLFSDVRITVLENTEDPDSVYRDVLVEVKEKNTGSVNFGVAVGSDSGLFGEISVNRQNFDLWDTPESIGELITGRAFRGAGQKFSMTFRPGSELFQYSVSFTEPHLLDSDYSLSVSGMYRERDFNQYDEERLTASIGVGRRFGDIWEGSVRVRGAQVELDQIEPDSPTEVFLDRGPDTLTGVAVGLTRSTIGTIQRPGKGSRLELELEQVGLLGGDLDFTKASAEYTVFLTLDEDFLGRKSILKLATRGGYIFNESGRVPTYERFYLGGRTFRGFEFRTVSPKGARNDTGEVESDPVGGVWSFFAGAQYEFPLVEEVFTGVFFVDSGTVTDDLGFDDYRVSVGLGVRLYVDALGPLPIAFDFGFPVIKGPGDELQVFSFSAEFPF